MAKQAGVSEATVSRVLNGKPGISDATRAAVLTALDVIGYERPTHLRVRRARMVGLIVPVGCGSFPRNVTCCKPGTWSMPATQRGSA